jgi:hypothetical protein
MSTSDVQRRLAGTSACVVVSTAVRESATITDMNKIDAATVFP